MTSKLSFLARDEYPEIRERVNLVDYDQALKGDFLEVWVNWDRAFARAMMEEARLTGLVVQMPVATPEDWEKRLEALTEIRERMFELNARYWGCEREHVETIWEMDVELYDWIVAQANKLRKRYQERKKK
jgi:hypothetical protein